MDCVCFTAADATALLPLAATVDWLVTAARGGPDADLVPAPGDEYFARFLDYPAEDRYLATHPR